MNTYAALQQLSDQELIKQHDRIEMNWHAERVSGKASGMEQQGNPIERMTHEMRVMAAVGTVTSVLGVLLV
jgi:hypothetical protein